MKFHNAQTPTKIKPSKTVLHTAYKTAEESSKDKILKAVRETEKKGCIIFKRATISLMADLTETRDARRQ